VDKSNYEKQLERDISNTNDPDPKRQLQRDLDRERSRRERQEDDNRAAAQIASQINAQKIADQRLQGGSDSTCVGQAQSLRISIEWVAQGLAFETWVFRPGPICEEKPHSKSGGCSLFSTERCVVESLP
jgi:hypothetical protein